MHSLRAASIVQAPAGGIHAGDKAGRALHVHHVQTKREIRALLAASGLRPRKRLGQNFLVDGNLMRRLVASARIGADDLVIEVGPGTGGLTDLLAATGARCVCVEIDPGMLAILEGRFRETANLTLIRGDALSGKHHLAGPLVEVITAHRVQRGGCVKLVANLPYQIATPLVMDLLVDYPQVRRLCFTVQAEVGARLNAGPNTKAFGPLSITTQALCDVEILARLAPSVFWPSPTVDSVMIRLDRKESAPLAADKAHRFASFVRGVFDHRRKTLRSALGYVLEDELRDHLCSLVDSKRRPESFNVAEWLAMFHAVAQS